jgi:SWI/SNF-related matrix-associated actin-dependent regulator of chromatin subfamily A-like protein 1
MKKRPAVAALPAPSSEVHAEALAHAERLATGLFPHQVDGIAFLLGRRRAILADDMGLGKTRQSIVAMTEAAPEGPRLVVCPASVRQNWAREIAAVHSLHAVHLVGPGAPPASGFDGWVIINYDLLSRHVDALQALNWAGIVFDEAHYLKNHSSQRSRLARRLLEAAPDAKVHALTGTPLTNRPRDLFPLLQLVGHPMGRSFLSFAKRYCDAQHNGFGWVTDGASNLEELRVQLHGVMLRRTKDEVLELPPKLRTWLPVQVADRTARKETRRVLETLIAGSLARAQAAPNGVKQQRGRERAAPGQDRVRLLAELTKARVQIARAKVAQTIDLVEGAVTQGEKVIVFSAFDEPVQRIAAHFGTRAVLLTGATPAAKRQALVDRFQSEDDVRVFVANLVAGGVGLNLTAARQVVFNDLDWVPANHWQAEDRAYRIGQRGTVSVTYLAAEGTIDEFVAHVLRVKSSLVESVVNGTGDAAMDGDLLSELESLVRTITPGIAGDEAASAEDPVDRLLREVTRTVAEREKAEPHGRDADRRLPAEALLALARVLAGPVSLRYRATSSSRPGAFYVLDVDEGGDVSCTCPGFEYRGACSHARSLKAALAKGGDLPAGIERVTDGELLDEASAA